MQNQIPENWQVTTLGGTATLNYGKGLPETVRSEGGVPVYGSSGISGYHNQSLVQEEGYIIGRKGTVGAVYYSPDPFYPIDTVYYSAKSDIKCDFKFFYYLLKTLKLNKLNSDSAVPGLNRDTAYAQPVLLPTLPEQERIASILSAFDDKTEVNNRITKTLEEMAQILFKEWFVKSECPIGKLSDIAKITMGQSPSSKFYNENGEGLPFHQGVTNFGNRFARHEVYCTENNRVAEKGDILFSVRAPVGRLNIADTKISLGRGVAAIRHKNNHQSYLYYLLKRLFKKEDSLGGGSVFPSVTKDDMEGMKIFVPDEDVVGKFENIVSNMDRKIEASEKENQKLAALRDLLLPKLMRGEVRV